MKVKVEGVPTFLVEEAALAWHDEEGASVEAERKGVIAIDYGASVGVEGKVPSYGAYGEETLLRLG